jgi:hypothetical protein
MTVGDTDNKTSKDINNARDQSRRSGPSEKQNHLWYQEYRESGAQFRMSYSAFRKTKSKEFYQQLKKKK